MLVIKHIFRYKLVSLYFILSQIIILVSILNVLRIFNLAYAKENDRLNALAVNRIEVDADTFANADILSQAADDVHVGNIIAEGKLMVDVSEIGSRNICEVLLAVNEAMPYPLLEGHIPGTEKSDYGKATVALGRDKYRYAYERDGEKYITVNQEEYRVVGVIGSNASDYWDYKIVFNINCMSDSLKKEFQTFNSYVISIYSNEYELTDSYNKVYENILKTDPVCNISAYSRNSTGNSTVASTLAKENLRTNVMVYIFCLINSVIISMFWVIQRRREFAIKRTFGFNNTRLLAEMAAELLALMMVSVALYSVFYSAFRFVSHSGNSILQDWNIKSLVMVFFLFVLTLLISMIYPILDIYRNSAEMINKS
jgi:hypothetical protein